METIHSDHAIVIGPPPLIYGGFLIVGWAINAIWRLPFLAAWLVPWLAAPFITAGLLLALFAVGTMRQARTTLDHHHPTTTIVTAGPYRWTRNPIYVAFTLIYVGIACGLNCLWALVLLPAALLLIDRGVIRGEEAYLERKFGDPYRQYLAHVRRWL